MLNLASRTERVWARRALEHLDALLLDHAHLEKKAAGMAVTLLFRYPREAALQRALARLAREELAHFEEVLAQLERRGVAFGPQRPSPYAGRLHRLVRAEDPGRLVDMLLVAALIEARSCERFALLAEALEAGDPELAGFYRGLCAAEARHHGVYFELAERVEPRGRVRARLAELSLCEAEILGEAPPEPRLHNGTPARRGDVQTSTVSKRIALDGIEIAYEECGRGERPLVLVHGFTGSRRDFAPRLPALASLGRTIALDLRGHGDSSNTGDPADYTLERLASDLMRFLAALGVGACDLLGHSMGGMVALRAALAEPGRIASLILMDTTPAALDVIPLDALRLAGRIARESGMAAVVALARARSADDPTRTGADRRLEAEWGPAYWEGWRIPNYESMDPAALVALGEAMVRQASLVPRLREIRCPTLVLVGEDDAVFLAPAEQLARGIRGARRVAIPGAGHQPQLETPDAWLAAIRGHLERARGG
jgi:tRNA 2-(methylsulfanyl)-N6-isopentenyladenosine37 hydroxylase